MRRLLLLALLSFLFAPPAQATVCVRSGSFTVNATTGNTSITFGTGVNCLPMVVKFFTTAASVGTNFTIGPSVGFMTATEQGSVFAGAQSDLDPSAAKSYVTMSNALYARDIGGAVAYIQLQYVSLNADGFTVNRVTVPGASRTVFFEAIGGLTNAKLVSFTNPTSTGNFNTTTIGFQPTYLELLSTSAITLDTATADARFNWGAVDGTNAGLVSLYEQDAAGTSVTARYVRFAAAQLEVLAGVSSVSAVDQRTSWVAWLSNGFTLNAVEVSANATQTLALAMSGGQWHVGSFSTQAATGNFNVTDGSFTPVGFFSIMGFSSTAQSTSDTATGNFYVGLGTASSSTARGLALYASANGRAINDQKASSVTTSFAYGNMTGNTTINCEGDFVAFLSNGVTLNATTVTVNNAFALYVSTGDNAASSYTPRHRVIRR